VISLPSDTTSRNPLSEQGIVEKFETYCTRYTCRHVLISVSKTRGQTSDHGGRSSTSLTASVISTLAGCDKAVDHHCILEETMASGCKLSHFVSSICRAVFMHGPKGPGPRVANFQGQHIKKIEIEVWYAGKKRLSTREKFKGDLY
jgi:hypothetical protein